MASAVDMHGPYTSKSSAGRYDCVFSFLSRELTVHLARPYKLCTPGEDAVYSFCIGDMQVDVARSHKSPYWSVSKVRISFVAEVPSSTQVVEKRGKLKWEQVEQTEEVWFQDCKRDIERVDW